MFKAFNNFMYAPNSWQEITSKMLGSSQVVDEPVSKKPMKNNNNNNNNNNKQTMI